MKALNATSKAVSSKNMSGGTTSAPEEIETPEPETTVHDFTDCCKSSNVTEKCLGFCTIHNIIDGTAGIEPE